MLTRKTLFARKTPFTSHAFFTRRNVLIAAAAGIALIAVLVSALAGLSSGPAPQAAPSPAGSPGLPSGVTQAGAVPTSVPNDPAARQNVHITDCSQADGGWKATGTAANPGKTPVDYTITVFFTTDHATVLNTADTTVKVEPGKTADWTISKKFTPTPTTLCALRGVGTT
ncbi:hypothetical protein [Arthrobacter bambusae]|uniref:hypothetical protein n=1 Tax=Arthrobacter bambusae TaxID=1338426 RepID=UPI002786E96B|nr:hypothetical protein [Arthrobacter bambusae]MDQ0031065.1 hypothetical protein [Arthrobacter bambusae]MDQ0098802.1 hypothetical protein [Arthrobacter bambusae]